MKVTTKEAAKLLGLQPEQFRLLAKEKGLRDGGFKKPTIRAWGKPHCGRSNLYYLDEVEKLRSENVVK